MIEHVRGGWLRGTRSERVLGVASLILNVPDSKEATERNAIVFDDQVLLSSLQSRPE